MVESVLKYQCTACGGPVHFDTETQMIICDYCGSSYPESHFTSETKEEKSETDWKDKSGELHRETIEMHAGFSCSNCGAEVVMDENTMATECMYCGNPIVITNKVSGMIRPDLVIPFQIDKEQAQQLLKEFYRKKVLLPSTFKSRNRVKKITGMYVPFWLFSGKSEGSMYFQAGKERTYTSGSYRVTETSHYDVHRSGGIEYSRIPVDASKKMEDNYMDGLEPYDYTALTEFSPSYMVGFFADKYDMDVHSCRDRAITRVIKSTRIALRNTAIGYDYAIEQSAHTKINVSDDEIKYVLLPVWILNTKYKDKMYHFAINGQTGKVSGDLPIHKMKKRLLKLVLTVAAFALYFGLSYLLMQV